MKVLGGIFLAIIAVALLIGLLFGFGVLNLEKRKYFEPKHREIDRKVYEQSASYVQGKISHISRMRMKYESSESETQKKALKTLIKTEASTVDMDLLPVDLARFIRNL